MKTYKIDTTKYTDDQINLLASFYSYQFQVRDEETGLMVANPVDKMDYIAMKFKAYADLRHLLHSQQL